MRKSECGMRNKKDGKPVTGEKGDWLTGNRGDPCTLNPSHAPFWSQELPINEE